MRILLLRVWLHRDARRATLVVLLGLAFILYALLNSPASYATPTPTPSPTSSPSPAGTAPSAPAASTPTPSASVIPGQLPSLSTGGASWSIPGTDCLRPPTPGNPKDGLAAWLDPGPTVVNPGDPFAENPTTSIYEVYGYGGFTTPIYDPGCLNGARFWDGPNDMANLATDASATLIATTVRLTRLVTDGTIGSILAPFTSTVSKFLDTRVLIPLIGLGVVLTGLYFLSRTRRADLADASTASLTTAGIIMVGVACATWALTIGSAIDNGITSIFTTTNQPLTTNSKSADAADTVAANLTHQLLYAAWEHKTFGNNPPAATEFGPRLFKAGTLSRTEQADIDAHPDTTTKVLDAKKDEYKRVARELQQKYPQAYDVLAGNSSWPRVGFAMAHLLATLIAVALLVIALCHIVYAIVVARIGIALAPGIALLTQHPKLHHHAINAATWVGRACLTAVAYTVVFVLVLTAGIGGILSPTTLWHPLAKALTMAVATIAILHLLRRMGLGLNWRNALPARRRESRVVHVPMSGERPPASPAPSPGDFVAAAPADVGNSPQPAGQAANRRRVASPTPRPALPPTSPSSNRHNPPPSSTPAAAPSTRTANLSYPSPAATTGASA